MKVFFRKFLTALLIVCFLFTEFPYKSFAKENGIGEGDVKYLKENKFEVVTENNLMVLYAVKTSGEFAVEDKRNSYIWYSNPKDRETDKIAQGVIKMDLSSQINLTYTDYKSDLMKTKNNFTGSVKKNSVKYEGIKNGFKVTYSFQGEDGFSIPINITLGDNYLNAEVDIDNLKETDNIIYSMDLLPYFGAGTSTDKGYIFVPDGSGALINFNNGKKNVETYQEAIYGRDNTFSSNQNPVKREIVKLPVFGIKNGENAFISVVDKGESQGTISANVSGIKSSFNNVFTSFDIRKFDSFIVGQGGMNVVTTRLFEKGKSKLNACAVRYYLLQGKEADYSGMATTYRDYLTKEKGLKAAVDIKPQVYLDLYGAVRKQKSVFGIPLNVIQPLTTYKDTENIMEDLKKAKVDNIVVNYHDWYSDAVDSKIPLSAAVIGKLGGTSGFKDLITYTKNNGIKFYPQVDFLNILKGNGMLLKFLNEARTISKTPATVFSYKLSTYFKDIDQLVYNLISPNSIDKIITKFNKSYKKYDIPGIGLDSISSMVYSDFSKTNVSTRQETETKWIDALKLMKQEFGSVEASAPNAYALPYVDYVLDAPSDSSHYYIEDETIPFYEMVIRGIKPYTIEAFNLVADKELQMLKAIETGANPHYKWIGEDTNLLKETKYENLYSSDYKAWMKTTIEDYKVFESLYDKLQNTLIVEHKKLEEGVFETNYSNGISVITNYSTVEYWEGNNIVAPKKYLIKEGGNLK